MYNKQEVREFLHTQVARPASAGVVLCNAKGEALVLKANYKPYWSFPGGWIEAGQSPREAALRELEEEAGIVLLPHQVHFLCTISRSSDIMQSYQFMFIAHTVYDDTLPVQIQPEEIDEYMFVSKADVKANPSQFGGAVQVWAEDAHDGYYEQTVTV